MIKTFKEIFLEEKQLEYAIANKWGYKTSSPLILRDKKETEEFKPIVANIQLRKLGQPIEKSEKIKQV